MERDQYATDNRRQDSGSQRRSQVTSIQKGQEFDVTIEDIGKKGDGIVKVEGYTVFVQNTEVGEKVRIKIKRVMETIAFADRLGDD
ncbi:TRAM domain-containing protein [Candidatus Woesearchaeota archaeon]|nr:TRAM domain-containing protein [Candidatus Woesearchaeota archaeon]